MVWIRIQILICGSMPVTNGSGSGSDQDEDPDHAIFVIKKKQICFKSLLMITF
jgi:hypothetical protein